MTTPSRDSDLSDRIERMQRRLLEAFDQLWTDYVDPLDAVDDGTGDTWLPLAGSGLGKGNVVIGHQLDEIRRQCRQLALNNEFAINGHENRISFIVGAGHRYRATVGDAGAADALAVAVQKVVDDFAHRNRWHQRQQEIVRRRDRDGEVFLRLFFDADGRTTIRFVEPEQVATPPHIEDQPEASCGIVTDPDDVEHVEAYYIDGRWTAAAEIQHRKSNVDANVKRGLPLFHPVRKNLRRAEKLLRNMTVVAEIQSAIALIRKHQQAGFGSVQQFVDQQSDGQTTHASTGRIQHVRRFGPGTILDAAAGIDYQFPTAAIDASRYVAVLHAELRAVASRLVMPEFMLTSDASNANYASTMVAEGPAVKMFERLQHDMIVDDLALLGRVVAHAAAAGRIPAEAAERVVITATPPSLAVRDRLEEARADEILVRRGAMSVATMATRAGLDPEREAHLRTRSLETPGTHG